MTDKRPAKFQSLSGGREPGEEKAATAGQQSEAVWPAEEITCPRCEQDIGVKTSDLVQFVRGARFTTEGVMKPKASGWACAQCLARGLFTIILETPGE